MDAPSRLMADARKQVGQLQRKLQRHRQPDALAVALEEGFVEGGFLGACFLDRFSLDGLFLSVNELSGLL